MHAVDALSGRATQKLYVQLENAATQLRRGELAAGRRAFANLIETLDEDQLEAMARTNALECHLMNTAEERERLRAIQARGELPSDGVAAALDSLWDAGFREKDF